MVSQALRVHLLFRVIIHVLWAGKAQAKRSCSGLQSFLVRVVALRRAVLAAHLKPVFLAQRSQ